ncbi:MAG: acetyl-CoA C-acyltransferase [Legionellales bacterium]|nr:acetyl-CoA C-acyltransferase [Legionellales bacterium]|tara:strand:- start:5 stop:1300 length:1296 start_codon:yes stop_codon:yes gene_type:complete
MQENNTKRVVYVVDGARTPFLKARNKPGAFTASDLAVSASRSLLTRMNASVDIIDEVITGCTMPGPDEANISRVIALRLGLKNTVPAFTVMRNCASGMQAIDNAMENIASGKSDVVLAGGTDAMSHAPLLLNTKMATWLGGWMSSKTIGQKLQMLPQLRLNYFAPVIALLKGLTDPIIGMSMGQTAEQIAYEFDISRQDMDNFAVKSHQHAAHAITENFFTEVSPIFDRKGNAYLHDDGIRADSSIEKLAKLKPFFDKKYGAVTAGNSSQITDGACFMLLASEQAVEKYQLPVIAKLVDCQWAALDPSVMGLGPIHAATPLLKQQHLSLKDIDFWEINEAFAAQVIGCVKAWNNADYCKQFLGLDSAFGEIPKEKLNVDGGAIALGHPVGASGARIILHLIHVLQRNNAKRGLASICIGGGQGGAVLIERI